MKAVIIADDDTAIERFSIVLKSAGYDIIIYRWLIKALDNIEEIAPHLILVSTLDYPRHWKTIAQYAQSGIGGIIPQIILFTEKDFSEDEKKKAEKLGIRGTFSSYSVEGLDVLRTILEKHNDIYSGALSDSEDNTVPQISLKTEPDPSVPPEKTPVEQIPGQEQPSGISVEQKEELSLAEISDKAAESSDINQSSDISETAAVPESVHISSEKKEILSPTEVAQEIFAGTESSTAEQNENNIFFIFTNPHTNAFVTGTVSSYENSILVFMPDCIPVAGLHEHDIITEAIIQNDDKLRNIQAVVQTTGEKLTLELRHTS